MDQGLSLVQRYVSQVEAPHKSTRTPAMDAVPAVAVLAAIVRRVAARIRGGTQPILGSPRATASRSVQGAKRNHLRWVGGLVRTERADEAEVGCGPPEKAGASHAIDRGLSLRVLVRRGARSDRSPTQGIYRNRCQRPCAGNFTVHKKKPDEILGVFVNGRARDSGGDWRRDIAFCFSKYRLQASSAFVEFKTAKSGKFAAQ